MELDSCLSIAARALHRSPSICTLTFPLHTLSRPVTVCSSCSFIDTGDALWVWVTPGGPFWPLTVLSFSYVCWPLVVIVWTVLSFYSGQLTGIGTHFLSPYSNTVLKYFLLLNFVFSFRHQSHNAKNKTKQGLGFRIRLTRSNPNCYFLTEWPWSSYLNSAFLPIKWR